VSSLKRLASSRQAVHQLPVGGPGGPSESSTTAYFLRSSGWRNPGFSGCSIQCPALLPAVPLWLRQGVPRKRFRFWRCCTAVSRAFPGFWLPQMQPGGDPLSSRVHAIPAPLTADPGRFGAAGAAGPLHAKVAVAVARAGCTVSRRLVWHDQVGRLRRAPSSGTPPAAGRGVAPVRQITAAPHPAGRQRASWPSLDPVDPAPGRFFEISGCGVRGCCSGAGPQPAFRAGSATAWDTRAGPSCPRHCQRFQRCQSRSWLLGWAGGAFQG